EGHAAAAAPGANLPLAVVLGDHGDVEPGERPHVAHGPPRGGGEQHHDLLGGQAGDHLLDPRIRSPRGGIDAAKKLELALERSHNWGLGGGVEAGGRPRPAPASVAEIPARSATARAWRAASSRLPSEISSV